MRDRIQRWRGGVCHLGSVAVGSLPPLLNVEGIRLWFKVMAPLVSTEDSSASSKGSWPERKEEEAGWGNRCHYSLAPVPDCR